MSELTKGENYNRRKSCGLLYLSAVAAESVK